MSRILKTTAIVGIMLTGSSLSVAYSPLSTTHSGHPVGWDKTQSIQYYLDPGTLGSYTNDQLHTLLKEAMKLWENVPNANVPKFEFAGYLPEDVNKDNYEAYIDLGRCFTDNMDYCDKPDVHDLKTRIIFDQWVLDNVLCLIRECNAKAMPITYEGGFLTDVTYAIQGQVVFGNPPGTSVADIVGWMAHELGHMLGLNHSFFGEQLSDLSNILEDPMLGLYIPTMAYGAGSASATLNPDDMAGIAVIYPADNFSEVTATIKGTVRKADGSEMQGVHVIARNVQDPLCMAYAFIAGRFCPHESIILSPTCLEPNGEYEISDLPAGDYFVEVQEINLDDSILMNIVYNSIAGDAEFWNEGDQADEDPYKYTVISLAAGETRENVDIILNRSEVTEDRVKYVPLDVILANFPLPETTACTDTTIDYAGLIGVDEGVDENATASGGCSLIIRK